MRQLFHTFHLNHLPAPNTTNPHLSLLTYLRTTMTRLAKRSKTPLLFIALTLLMIGCERTESSSTRTANQVSEWDMDISEAWVRPTKAGMMSAAYFNLSNQGATADTLVRARSTVSDDVQIHRSYQKDGLMVMEEQPFVDIASNSVRNFAPGGYHIMIINSTIDLTVGDEIPMTLFFSSGMILEQMMPVRLQP